MENHIAAGFLSWERIGFQPIDLLRFIFPSLLKMIGLILIGRWIFAGFWSEIILLWGLGFSVSFGVVVVQSFFSVVR